MQALLTDEMQLSETKQMRKLYSYLNKQDILQSDN